MKYVCMALARFDVAWIVAAAWLLNACGGTANSLITVTPGMAPPTAAMEIPTPTIRPTRTPAPALDMPQRTPTKAQESEEQTMTPTTEHSLTITIVYDNNAYAPELTTAWGFAAVVAYDSHTLLFDTGGQGAILLRNMNALGINPLAIEHVVLSHAHNDHTGGLQQLLATGARPVVHLLPSFADNFKQQVAAQTKAVETAPGLQMTEGVFVTGEIAEAVPEQALVLATGRGLVIITGCAHPGVDRIVARAQELSDRPIYLVLGGFHLGSANAGEITRILRTLRQMGVQKVAPCHCTGERAIAMFAEEYGEDFIQAGVGRRIVLEPRPR